MVVTDRICFELIHPARDGCQFARSTGSPEPKKTVKPDQVLQRWMDVSMFDRQPLNKNLSGLDLEYRIIELYSRDHGKREAKLMFDVGQGTQDIGFRNQLAVLFDCRARM